MKTTGWIKRTAAFAALAVMTVVMTGCGADWGVLDPKGQVGKQQLDLIIISTLLCLVVVVPVLVLTAVIVWRYRMRADSKAKYDPNWSHSTKLEAIWWGVPIVIILALAIVTAIYTYKLEPSKPLEHEAKPITIQVVSLDWKWLFLYPEQGIATVGYVQFPEDVPVHFQLTSDAPMNSFWIPRLGGQIYTMSGMAMSLNLIADEPGEYMGSGANFSGKDFAKMQFTAKASSQQEFDDWVKGIKSSSSEMTKVGYDELAKPGVTEEGVSYSAFPQGLFDQIVNKYGEGHEHGGSAENKAEGHEGHEAQPAATAENSADSQAAESQTNHHEHHE
ncbi:ubiquinol oxidase subunit II [Cohnella faecalis]|uniref:Quinol oxidase subunit 2 n=1 Tax=Cohnella faecalis TaxID=2315694 RepID=A0A398CSK5_9BACL|nr:ubiquinol oxidase subunit II [Cohnella faecalis]RIE01934.1 ubiquinol oxidase subunit II [Cohnella faecalis]